MTGNVIGNEIMGMGRNGMPKVIPTDLYYTEAGKSRVMGHAGNAIAFTMFLHFVTCDRDRDLTMPTIVAGVKRSSASVCLSVCLSVCPHNRTKNG